ncbi:MAG: Uma2 family endonuclease [Thermoanaerobaculia bacterium]
MDRGQYHLGKRWRATGTAGRWRGLRSPGPASSHRFDPGLLPWTHSSGSHERIKSLVGCLVEVWCLEHDVEFTTVGSWTLEDKTTDRGVEPDECYIFGPPRGAPRPDLAIEVIWTSGGIDKLEIDRKLGVAEVWIWRRGALTPHVLRGESYEAAARSEALPGIDLGQLTRFLEQPTTSAAIRAYRDFLRKG